MPAITVDEPAAALAVEVLKEPAAALDETEPLAEAAPARLPPAEPPLAALLTVNLVQSS